MEVWFSITRNPAARPTRAEAQKRICTPRSSEAPQESFCPLDKDLSWKSESRLIAVRRHFRMARHPPRTLSMSDLAIMRESRRKLARTARALSDANRQFPSHTKEPMDLWPSRPVASWILRAALTDRSFCGGSPMEFAPHIAHADNPSQEPNPRRAV